MDVLTPKVCNASLVKLPMEFAFSGANGDINAGKTGEPEGTDFAVNRTYCCNNIQGQISGQEFMHTIASHFGLVQPFLWTRMKGFCPIMDTVRYILSKSTFLHNIKNRRHKIKRVLNSPIEFQFNGLLTKRPMISEGS